MKKKLKDIPAPKKKLSVVELLGDDDDEQDVIPPPVVETKPKKKLPEAPFGFCSIAQGDDRVMMLRVLTKDASDVLVYHYRLGCLMHLHARDLNPPEHVRSAVEFLVSIKD